MGPHGLVPPLTGLCWMVNFDIRSFKGLNTPFLYLVGVLWGSTCVLSLYERENTDWVRIMKGRIQIRCMCSIHLHAPLLYLELGGRYVY